MIMIINKWVKVNIIKINKINILISILLNSFYYVCNYYMKIYNFDILHYL